MRNRMLLVFLAVVVTMSLILAGCAAPAPEEEFPTHSVELVIPYSAGGGIDMNTRCIVAVGAPYLGQPFIAVIKPGAAGAVGAEYVARAPADGYTILVAAPDPFFRGLVEELPFSMDSFKAVGMVSNDPELQFVRSDSPFQTWADVVAAAREKPGEITVGVCGLYGMEHLTYAFIEQQEGVEFNFIPYPCGGPVLAAVLGGHADCGAGLPPVLGPQIAAGTIRAFSVASAERLDYDPFKDIPTLKEIGYDFTMNMWVPLLVPKDTPEPIIKKLESVIAQIVEDKSFLKLHSKMGITTVYKNATDATEYLRSNMASMKKVVEGLKAK